MQPGCKSESPLLANLDEPASSLEEHFGFVSLRHQYNTTRGNRESRHQFFYFQNITRVADDELEPCFSRRDECLKSSRTRSSFGVHLAVGGLRRDVKTVHDMEHLGRWRNSTVGLHLYVHSLVLQFRQERDEKLLVKKRFPASQDEMVTLESHHSIEDLPHGHRTVVYPCSGPILIHPRVFGVAPDAGQIAEVGSQENARRANVHALSLHTEEDLRYRQLILDSLRVSSLLRHPGLFYSSGGTGGGPLTRLRNGIGARSLD